MPAPEDVSPTINGSTPPDRKGWDGKLRVDRRAVITNPEALSDPDYSDEDAPPVEPIEADEGMWQSPIVGVQGADGVIGQICWRSMRWILMYASYA